MCQSESEATASIVYINVDNLSVFVFWENKMQTQGIGSDEVLCFNIKMLEKIGVAWRTGYPLEDLWMKKAVIEREREMTDMQVNEW